MRMLPKHKHVEMAIQTALLEFREGSAERGRGVMEGVLKNYPKRTDLWSVYLDQEVKLGDVRRARQLFDRATSAGLLVFYVLAMQCLPTLAVTRRETGSWKWPMVQFAWMSAVAYALAFATRMLVLSIGGGG